MRMKKHFLTYIEQAEKIIDFKQNAHSELLEIKENLTSTELIIPVVGGFSAGKSTLINSLLGENLLPTKVTPETALATELRYSTENYIEAINQQGNIERYELNQLGHLRDHAKNYQFLRLFIDHKILNEINPLILVDMPGFDAPIEAHNQAILRYLNKGTYFIFLTSIEDGNLTRSMMREIENIQLFAKDFSFGLSKTNLRSPNDVQEVKKQIEEQLVDYFDFHKEVILFDQQGGKNLHKILTGINSDKLFQSLFQKTLENNYFQAIEEINIQLSTLKTSQTQSDKAIKTLKNSLKEIIRKKENSINEIESKYSNQSIESIINAVANDLNQQYENLISLALSNQEVFSREINEIIKNSLLVEVQRRFSTISGQIVEDLSFNLRNDLGNLEGFNFSDDFINRLQDKVSSLLNYAQSSLKETTFQTPNNNQSIGFYRGLTTILGLTTNIVSPIIEVLIIFLPDILNFFSQGIREKKIREEIERKLIGKIIPQIKSKIRSELPIYINEQIRNLIININDQFASQIEQKEKEISQAAEERERNSQQLDKVINDLNQKKVTLTQLANQYLFKIGEIL